MAYTKTNIANLAGISVPLLRYYLSKFDRDGHSLKCAATADEGSRVVYDRDDAMTLLSLLAATFRQQGKDRKALLAEKACEGVGCKAGVGGKPGESPAK
jgi:hypothetical protein